MTSTIPMDLLMIVFAAGEGKLATIPPDIAPIIDELRARERGCGATSACPPAAPAAR